MESVLRLQKKIPEVRLRAGGYLAPHHQSYLDDVRRLAKPLGDAFEYIGSPSTHAEKVSFYKSIDVFSVPARFQEPKGLYVLEAWANGLPVVLPDHAAFPALIESTGGGLLAEHENPDSVAALLHQVLTESDLRKSLATAGYNGVREKHDMATLAEATRERLLQKDEGRFRAQIIRSRHFPFLFILHPSSFILTLYRHFPPILLPRRVIAVGKIGILVTTRIFGTVYQFHSPILPLGADCCAR